MFRGLLARIALSAAIAGAAMLGMPGAGFAASVTGKITAFHLSGDNAGGEVCVGLTPALPSPGWACVRFDNKLFKELAELLLRAYLLTKTCSITWNITDNEGFFLIAAVECR